MGVNKRLIGAGAAGGPFVNNENFRVVTYTGNGGTQSITGVGFQPDFVWHKARSSAHDHNLTDSTRGVKKGLNINDPRAEGNQDPFGVTSFDADGFTVNDNSGGGASVNGDGITYVVWCWKGGGGPSSNSNGSITSTVNANAAAGFSIVKYTGTGSSGSVGHGLNSDPKLIINKRIASSSDWLAGAVTWTKYLEPNGTPAFRTANVWTDTQPTSTTFGVIGSTSASSVEYITYCFADVAGYQKISTYTGNGSTNGPFVNVGFEPAYVMVKNLDSADNWLVFDNARNTSNPRTQLLQWNINSAESTEAGAVMNFYSNGFQSVGTGGGGGSGQINANGDSYLYWAIAANPDTEAPTLASSFNIETYVGTGASRSITGLGFGPGLTWIKHTDGTGSHSLTDVVRGDDLVLQANETSAEASGQINLDSDGFTIRNDNALRNSNNAHYAAWNWKADDNEPTINSNGSVTSITSVNDNAGFSVVKATAPSSGVFTVGHGQSSALDFFVIKRRDSTGGWIVYFRDLGSNKYLLLNDTAAAATDTNFFDNTHPTSTVFTLNAGQSIVGGADFVAYCFANVTAYQKFGTYTGTGSAGQTITTGFKPDFILIKSTVGTANWHLYDTRRERGLNQFLQPNNNDPQEEHVGNSNPHIELLSTGFSITADGVTQGNNASGLLYVYWAIAKNVPSNNTLAGSFKAVAYTGTGVNPNTISAMGFKPDFLWIKGRSNTEHHYLYDRIRGSAKYLHSSNNAAEGTDSTTRLTSFNSDGFSLSTDSAVNGSTQTYIAWGWKAGDQWQSNLDGTIDSTVNVNTGNGFSIVKYVGSGSNATVGHGLSSSPNMIIIKRTDGGSGFNWIVGHTGLSFTSNETLTLDSSGSKATFNYFNATNPTSTVFSLGTGANTGSTNSAGGNYIAYCFHDVSGYSKFANYTGTGSSNSITGLGFKPDFLVIKEADGTDSWEMYDSVRGANKVVYSNGNNAEVTGSTLTSFDSDGFTVSSATSINESGKTYIYWAVAMNPTLNTTLANSFKTVLYDGDGTSNRKITGLGFRPDFVWIKRRSATRDHYLFDSVRGTAGIYANLNLAQFTATANDFNSFDDDGFTVGQDNNTNSSGNTMVAWCWKAGNNYVSNINGSIPSIVNANTANGFSIVHWHGTQAAGATVGHGLGAAPEMIIVKRLDFAEDWVVYHSSLGNTKTLNLNTNDAEVTDAAFNNTTPSSTVFTLSNCASGSCINSNSGNYIAYCWHSVAGYSKIGSYTGTGSDGNAVTTGFKPDFLMVKRSDSSGGWLVFDSARSPSNPVNDRIEWNNDQAEQTDSGSKFVDFNTNDFEANGSDSELNASGATYLYMAIKMN